MTNIDIGKKLVALCREGKSHEAKEAFYAPDIASVEAFAPPGAARESHGLAGSVEKGKQFQARNEVHGMVVEGPFPHGDDKFAVVFRIDMTDRASGKRQTMDEIGVYTVRGGKIVREEFYYGGV